MSSHAKSRHRQPVASLVPSRPAWTMVLAMLFAYGQVTASEASASDSTPDAAIDRLIEGQMHEGGLVGLGAAVIVDRKLVWARGYGHADRQRGIAFTPDTVMNIGSISKTFTGVALMQAVQEGKLSLDADINRYLPFKVVNPAFPDAPITLRQLATHTSGISDRWEVYQRSYHWGSDPTESLGDFLAGYLVAGGKDHAKENFVPFEPGTHREYSNIAAGLAGYIVERAVGQPLNVYTRERIFKPLKMQHSGWLLSEIPPGQHSTLYVGQDGFSVPIQPYALTTYPDGGVRTSLSDLSTFFIALLDDGQYDGARILDASAAAEMKKFQYTQANKPGNVVLAEKNSGIFWSTKYDVTRVGHGGSDPGVHTDMLSDLPGHIAVVLMVNTSLAESNSKVYSSLLDALWKHAATLERNAPQR